MPIYSYKCKGCGREFDLLVGVSSEKTAMLCPGCKSPDIEKTIAVFSAVVDATNKGHDCHSAGACCGGSGGGACPGGMCPM